MNWKSCALLLFLTGCEITGTDDRGEGELRIAFADSHHYQTRGTGEIPDTSDFLIAITDSNGKSFFEGIYADCPESLILPAGNYIIKTVSTEFEEPEFSAPQYGDEQCVVIPKGGVTDVRLVCTQLNAGVRLRISKDFLTQCPDGVLFLKSDQGKLMYGYSEKRIAYFLPGRVSLVLSSGGKDETLMSRTLLAQEILSLGVSVASSSIGQSAGRLTVGVDTSRNWISDSYVIGGANDKGEDESEALTVMQARAEAGRESVWVCGYIVGGDLTSASASFDEPFASRTNILLGPKSSTVDKDVCLSVQLPSGKLRDALNLVDNPHLLGTKIYLCGDIVEAYFGIPGIKNISEYRLP